MPRGDRTGPDGMGSMTGRGLGDCNGYETPGFTKGAPRGGAGFGNGRGLNREFGVGFGRGNGYGRRFNDRGFNDRRFNRGYANYAAPQYSAQDEAKYLENEIEALKNELKAMENHLTTLKEDK